MSTDNSIKSSISLVLFARINFNRRRRRLSGDMTWQSPGANLRDVFIVWRLKRFLINKRPWYVGYGPVKRVAKEKSGNGPPAPEREIVGAPPTRRRRPRHAFPKSLFVVTDPSAPGVPSILIWSRRSSWSLTIRPLSYTFIRVRDETRLPECRSSRITICDVDFISIPRP